VGRLRDREVKNCGGHNGLKSIIAAVGTIEFVRLRIGIQPEHPISDAKGFVLDTFARSERPVVIETVEQIANAIRTIIRDGALKAMAEFN
jgi:PTH1 family peptidyl-tRNA hydrolase